MSSLAHTQPRTGRRKFNLRAYLAGTAATAALIGAVVLAFASLGAYVAFNGLPIGGSDSGVEASSVAVGPASAPANKAGQSTSQDTAAADVRRTQGSQVGVGATGGAGGSASQTSSPAADTAAPPATTGSEPTVAAGGSQETAPTPPQAGPSDDPPSSQVPTPQVTAPGAVGGTLGTVEQTLQEVGVEAPINGSGSVVEEVTGGLVGGN